MQLSRADLYLKNSSHFFKTTPGDLKVLFFTACSIPRGIDYVLGVKFTRNTPVPVETFPSNSIITPALTFAAIVFSVGWLALVLLPTIEKQLSFPKWNREPNLAPKTFITGYDVQKWENAAWLSEHIAVLLNWQGLKQGFFLSHLQPQMSSAVEFQWCFY